MLPLNGVPALICAPDGPPLAGRQAALDLIGDAMGHGADLVVVPVARLGEDFFALRSGLAGEVVQKFADYRLRLAIVGDVSTHVAASTALRDFVREANRGTQIRFADTIPALAARLAARA
ncbi:DUF4180 domain-containing protein [Streptomyces sp. CB03238]|uniref:DUF4180 domain-containing protein n=1 Tax=Streptomyces sp. CB03238 TaxID=1907777 RepID=UPI001F4EA560|nr:DUF4180 domain-containing protein [Streptomyces sp. CB03238]